MKQKSNIIILVILTLALFSGCTNNNNQSLLTDNKKLKDENTALSKQVSEIKVENQKLQKNTDSSKEKPKAQESNQGKGKLVPVFKANTDTYKKEIGTYVYISDNAAINEKLNILTKVLSQVYFNNLPIEVVKIEKVDGKQVAVINLKESKENEGIKDVSKLKGRTWATGYFQGSTGGQITSTSLIETMLQRDYKDEWIDGVKFLYNNKVCDFQHSPDLNKINYR